MQTLELCAVSNRRIITWLLNAGEVVLYSWAEWLKEQQHLWAPAPEPEHVDSDAELAAALQQVLIISFATASNFFTC